MQWTEGEIDSPCVRFFTCPLPVLVICCQMLDMTLTERWRHHIGILPRRLPAALPPVCLHQRLTFPLRLSFPLASFLPSVTRFRFIVIPLLSVALLSPNCNILFLGTFHMIITFNSPPSNSNLHILITGRTWKSQLDSFSLCFFLPICNYQLCAIYLLFIIPGHTFVLTLFLSCLPLLSSMHLYNTVYISSQGEDLQMLFLKITIGNTADII